MIKLFVLIAMMTQTVFADMNEMTTVLHTINKYDVGAVISSQKLEKYKDDIQKLMEDMRRNKGAKKGEPYLLTCEIIQTDISNNLMKVSISLTLGRYKVLKDERSFFQFFYSKHKEISLDLDNEYRMKLQLMHQIKKMLRHFKMML